MESKTRNNELKYAVSGKEKMNTGATDKIYNYLSGEKDYVDLPETEQTRKKVKAYAMGNLLSTDDEEDHKQWIGLEKVVSEFGVESERQGFIYGFRYASELFVRNEKPCVCMSRLDESIKEEYSMLAVEGTDRTDPMVDILKEYVPEEKFAHAVGTLCACMRIQSMLYSSRDSYVVLQLKSLCFFILSYKTFPKVIYR